MIATSKPRHANNAIEAALFVVVLNQPVDQVTAARINVALETVASELPGTQQPVQQGMLVHFGGVVPPFGEAMRFRALADGTHEWRVQLSGPLVQVSCQKFSSFSEVWQTAQRYLRLVLSEIDPQMAVLEIGLQVIDKFEYDEVLSTANYSMQELYRPDSPYLTPKSWQSGQMWHVYQGWFDPYSDELKVLHQLNVSNTVGVGDQIVSIIDHRIAARTNTSQAPALGTLVGEGADNPGQLDALFQTFHRGNLDIIRKLLTAAKLDAIGMKAVS